MPFADSKSGQTDEEKNKDRQRNERELKQAEVDAINKREQREAREARQLEHEIITQRKQIQERERQHQCETQRAKQHKEDHKEGDSCTDTAEGGQHLREQRSLSSSECEKEQLAAEALHQSEHIPFVYQQQHQPYHHSHHHTQQEIDHQHQKHHQHQQQKKQQQEEQQSQLEQQQQQQQAQLEQQPAEDKPPPQKQPTKQKLVKQQSTAVEDIELTVTSKSATPPKYSRDNSTEMEDEYHQHHGRKDSSPPKQSQQQQQNAKASTTVSTTATTTTTCQAATMPNLGSVIGAFIPASSTSVAFFASIFNEDSTESDQSLTTYSQNQFVPQHVKCRAPIASLDCMEEFSGTGGHLDFGRSISLGSNPALPMRHSATVTPGLRYKNLGKSGLRISNVGLGTWPLFTPGVSEEMAENILMLAMDSGINLFDLAEPNSESMFGKVIAKCGWKRSTYVIATKIYWSTKSEERGLSRKHIIESVKASLQRIGLDYIDLVIIHKADSMCPMEEIVRAMNYIISQGWAMYWGTSRWTPVEIMESYTNCRQFNCITPIVEQAEYHMFCREKAELYLPEMYNKIGVGLMAWGPLSMALGDTHNTERGLFFSKGSFIKKSQSYSWTEDEVNNKEQTFGMTKEQRNEDRKHTDKLRDLAVLAEKLGCSPTQLSIAWSLKHEPVQCLMIGATTLDQLHQNLQALQLLPRLSTSVMLELERILDNKPIRPPLISTLALR